MTPEERDQLDAATEKTRDKFGTRNRPVDPLLESILDQSYAGDPESSKKSTFDKGRRRIFRAWPRDPDGPVMKYSSEGKRAPNATHLWGSTLFDFYYVHRMPFQRCSITITTGSKMAPWCKSIGEVDYAAQEIDWADNAEKDPKRIEAANVAEIHEAQVDYGARFSSWGKAKIEEAKNEGNKDDDTENFRTPFHPSSYPSPYPLPPFASERTPTLETPVPLHLLPEKLIVHDPSDVLRVSSGDVDEYVYRESAADHYYHQNGKRKEKERWDDPWPYDTSDPNNPKGYKTQIYKLQLSSSTVSKIAKTRESLAAAATDDPVLLLYVYPNTQCGETRDPLFQITVPPPPPPPTRTPEAHLYLTRSPDKVKGVGNHSAVFEAEWEIPREWFVKPRICVACVMERAKAVKEKWVAEEEARATDTVPPVSAPRDNESELVEAVLNALHQTEHQDMEVEYELDENDENLKRYMAETEAEEATKPTTSDPDIVMGEPSASPVTSQSPEPYPDDNLIASPSTKQVEIELPESMIKTWGRRDSKSTSGYRPMRPHVGRVCPRFTVQQCPKVTIGAKQEHEVRREHEKLAKQRREGRPDPWEKERTRCERDPSKDAEGEEKKNDGEKVDAKGKGKAKAVTVEDAENDVDQQKPGEAEGAHPETEATEEHQEEVIRTSLYQGMMHIVHVGSVSWLLPGDPPCNEHSFYDLRVIDDSDATKKKDSPCPVSLLPATLRPCGRLPPTMRVVISAKASIPGDRHLVREARNYQKFDPSFGEHWTGYTVARPLHEPTPCGALVPAFYGYYVREKEGAGEIKTAKPKVQETEVDAKNAQSTSGQGAKTEDKESKAQEEEDRYFSPLLLLEDCGEPVDADTLNLDDRRECSALLLRFHELGWIHGSFAHRNMLMRRGDHTDYPMERSKKDKRFRLVDFGRSEYLEDWPKDDTKNRDHWDSRRYSEKTNIWQIMKLPFPV
ncbi:hypothetical protein V5O48_005803 [Marasmius crinis-equi]|uniref:Protein kinase domain-containing protein n=1 Tax=Marasmius crinis-equi TaxID=585013 RepID=A0ABR3FL86_9AGAR